MTTRNVLVELSMLTEIEDGDDPKADRKRWIGTGHPWFSLDRDEDHDHDKVAAAIEDWVWMWSILTVE